MATMMQEVMPRFSKETTATTTRLQLFLEETVIKSRTIPEPPGRHLKRK